MPLSRAKTCASLGVTVPKGPTLQGDCYDLDKRPLAIGPLPWGQVQDTPTEGPETR